MSDDAQSNGKRFQLQSNLRVLLEEYIKVCYQCDLNKQEIAQEVVDCLYDASDNSIRIQDVTIH